MAAFAFDEAELDPEYSRIAPCSLLLSESPPLPVLTAANPLTSTDQLLIDLGFNPSTKNRYSDSSGTEIIGETNRSLQIKSNGDILYQSGGDPAVEIDSSDDTPSLREAADGFRRPAAEAPG